MNLNHHKKEEQNISKTTKGECHPAIPLFQLTITYLKIILDTDNRSCELHQ